VEIEAFVDAEAIDPPFFEKPYFLVPAKKAEKGYVLLREVLKKSKKVGIAKVVIRTRQYLASILPLENALLLNLMRFPQELVPADEFKLPESGAAKYRITPKELEMATALVESMATSWNPADYKDDFRAKLHALVSSRVGKSKRGRKLPDVAEQSPAASNVVDFMALLKKSIAAKQPATRARSGARPRRAG
jgi:DNA end-binding protein Ku